MNNLSDMFDPMAEFDCTICHPDSTAAVKGVCDEHRQQEMDNESKRQADEKEAKRQRGVIQKVRSGFPYEFQMCDLKNVEPRCADKIKTWINDGLDWCLFLQGDVGLGKSYMAYSTIKYALSEGFDDSFRAFSSMDLVTYMQRDYDGSGSDHYKELQEVSLLLIDDLGTERTTEDAQFQVMRLIYSRHTEMKKTIITTNLGIDALAEKFHPRLTSRIMGGTPIVLKGSDRRLTNPNKQET